MKIAIVAEHASARFGGEAILPLQYFRILRDRNYDVWLVVHERTSEELEGLFGNDPRVIFTPDTPLIRLLWRLGAFLPQRVANFSTGYLMRLLTQRRQVKEARRLVREEGVQIVHQPIPVSPREPSMLFRLGAPVVVGPLNGGMEFPSGFRDRSSVLEDYAVAAARAMTNVMNRLIPGKRQASVVMVANKRSRMALPAGLRGKVIEICENGVDFSLWGAATGQNHQSGPTHTRFVFTGRLVDWKAVDLLLQAFARAKELAPMSLLIMGDGDARERLEKLAGELDLLSSEEGVGKVRFAGWLSQKECADALAARDALVLPSLYECGGAVVLEAMALSKPVIATAWGGPLDYLNAECGILVPPLSPDALIDGLAEALRKLASSPELRVSMGQAAQLRVRAEFDWERKVDAVLDVYASALRSEGGAAPL